MELFNYSMTTGQTVTLKTTDPRHYTGKINDATGRLEKENPSFQDKLFEALHGANKVQQEANDISLKMITDPDSLDAHDVTLALSKANSVLQITKAIVDKGLQAYKEILSFR